MNDIIAVLVVVGVIAGISYLVARNRRVSSQTGLGGPRTRNPDERIR